MKLLTIFINDEPRLRTGWRLLLQSLLLLVILVGFSVPLLVLVWINPALTDNLIINQGISVISVTLSVFVARCFPDQRSITSLGLKISKQALSDLVVGFFIRRMPYIFRSTTASLSQIDVAVEEASAITGASWLSTFRKITLPLMAPGILAGAVISFSTLMGELSTTVILYSARWKTITVAIVEYLFSATIGPAYALGTILIVLVLVAITLANRILGRRMSQMFKMM